MTKRNIVTDLMNEYIAWGGRWAYLADVIPATIK